MPVPKRKKSKSRKGMRRAHQAISSANPVECPRCSSQKLPHHVCNFCGYYNDRDVLKIDDQV